VIRHATISGVSGPSLNYDTIGSSRELVDLGEADVGLRIVVVELS